MRKVTAVREKPILFSGPMVRAILDGCKTQTRRIVKPQPEYFNTHPHWRWKPRSGPASVVGPFAVAHGDSPGMYAPWQPGDMLWVRESFKCRSDVDWASEPEKAKHYTLYRADDLESDDDEMHWHDYGDWRPSIHMPRCLSRLTLEITDVRVERLQDISAEDVDAEGLPESQWSHVDGWRRDEFRALWNEINGPGSWETNPWVWVISFRRLEATPCDE